MCTSMPIAACAGAGMWACIKPLELGQQAAWYVRLSGATMIDLPMVEVLYG